MEFDKDVANKMWSSCPGKSIVSAYEDESTGKLVEELYYVPDYELLLLGLAPTEETLGWLYDYNADWAEAIFDQWKTVVNKLHGISIIKLEHGFMHIDAGWNNRINGGEYFGTSCDIMNMWGKASIAVQWHPPHPSRRGRRVA